MIQTRQMVQQFGYENVPVSVQHQFDKGDYEIWHNINHLIEPNPSADDRKSPSRFKPWRSVYWTDG
ncbi:MAG: phage tail protein, partial [Anaerolineae bacterium]|nr:phage tail protein [Anaerolineae bacterium]